ncbi:MAG TPA: MBL fold metallo-hydrolase [Actinomycetaceae bacterium]|nr:MBL fold metallo-hydrolase [Actinomycetaceae bacterium]
MRLTVIGCTGSMSGPASPASCYLVQATGPGDDGVPRTWTLVLDLGPGAFGRLLGHMDPADVDMVVLSHLHADHISDMISYHVFRRWHPNGALGPVRVLAPAGAVDRVRGVGGDGPEEMYAGEFTFERHREGEPLEIGPFRIESFLVVHPVEAYAVRITGPSENGSAPTTLTFTGDADTCESLVEASRGVDLLLADAAFVDGRDEVRGIHLTGTRAGEVAAEAGAGRLVLTHIQPWTDLDEVVIPAREAYGGEVETARSGAVWEL